MKIKQEENKFKIIGNSGELEITHEELKGYVDRMKERLVQQEALVEKTKAEIAMAEATLIYTGYEEQA